jgi:hypothetical protein
MDDMDQFTSLLTDKIKMKQIHSALNFIVGR